MKLPRVSDHAVLRFLERSYGFDIAAVRVQIAQRCAPAAAARAASIKVDGGKFIISRSGEAVVTFTPDTINKTMRDRLASGVAS